MNVWRRSLPRQHPIYGESDKAMSQAIALAPQDASTYILIGALQKSRKNWPEEEKAYQKAAELAGNNSLYWSYLGAALCRR